MKTIKIKSLQLTNFKGIKSLQLDDLGQETSIYGDNGTGKTTVFDAFTWLLFGKDSTDRKDFEIKTLDKDNNAIPKIEHVVSAVLEVNGSTVELKKTLKEKWVTKRGSMEAEFTGNETLYEWNGVPMNAGDYTAKINNIVNEQVFKMITSTVAFNAMKWQDQRDVLIELAGNITDEDIASDNLDFNNLLASLEGKTLDEYKKQVKASISKAKQEIKAIPTRIDEVERSKPEAIDFDKVRDEIKSFDDKIDAVGVQINDKSKAHQAEVDKKRDLQKQVYALETEILETNHKLKQEARTKFNKLNEEPRLLENQIERIDADIKGEEQAIKNRESKIEYNNRQLHSLDRQRTELMSEWEKVNASKFQMDEKDCKCPTCKRDFEADVLEEQRKELEVMFNTDKRKKLESIDQKGQQLKKEVDELNLNNSNLTKEIGVAKASLKDMWTKRAELSEALQKVNTGTTTETEIFQKLQEDNQKYYADMYEKINVLKAKLQDVPEVDNSELQAELKALTGQRDELKMELQKEARIKEADQRIEQLANEEKQLAQTIASQEKEMYVIESFEKAKSDRIETSVNSMFKHVNFKLFKTLINGGEEPTCKALINGVPYSDANTASKINAGLDIINTLCNHYGVTAPIFIDNRESVVELIYSPSQIINLVVSEGDKKLRVLTMSLEEVA